jgi:hypothetical protein
MYVARQRWAVAMQRGHFLWGQSFLGPLLWQRPNNEVKRSLVQSIAMEAART